MSLNRNGSVGGSSAPGFSYAQAAKGTGRSTSAPSGKIPQTGVSGTATPSTTSMTDSTPGTSWGDEVENAASESPSVKKLAEPSTAKPNDDIQDETTSRDAKDASSVQVNGDSAAPVHTQPTKESSHEGDMPASAKGQTVSEIASNATESEGLPQTDGVLTSKEGQAPPKPVLQEAKPPTVNIWDQRRQANASKAPPAKPASPNDNRSGTAPAAQTNGSDRPTGDKTKGENRKVRHSWAGPGPEAQSANSGSKEVRKGESSTRHRDDTRNGPPRRDVGTDDVPARRGSARPREQSVTEKAPPTMNNEVSWPKPTDVQEEDKKKVQEREDKDRGVPTANRPHSKPEWKTMQYTPNAIFETALTSRGGPKIGRGGRGASNGVGRPFPHGTHGSSDAKPGTRAASLPSADSTLVEEADVSKTDRDAMPPQHSRPNRATSMSSWKDQQGLKGFGRPKIVEDAAEGDPDSDINAARAAAPSVPASRQTPAPRRNKSPRRSEIQNTRPSNSDDAAGRKPAASHPEGNDNSNLPSTSSTDASQAKPTFAERRADSHTLENGREGAAPRESKRGARRGGRGSGHSSSVHHVSDGFMDFQSLPYGISAQQSHHARGGHYQRGSGFRHQSARSHSIPVDAYGRPSPTFNGYPMMPQMPAYGNDYYAMYGNGQFTYPPASERDLALNAVSGQLEYYFSFENMVKDLFLRKHMDSQGFIFLGVIADFNRLKQLNADYEMIKSVCLYSDTIEIRVGEDGKERVRRHDDWARWILPMEERDPSARNAGPSSLRRPSVPDPRTYGQTPSYLQSPVSAGGQPSYGRNDQLPHLNSSPVPFSPMSFQSPFPGFTMPEEPRGRQSRPTQAGESSPTPATNGFSGEHGKDDADNFPSSQIDGLTVVVRKHDLGRQRTPYHSASLRTFSNGSIDTRNIIEEIEKVQAPEATTAPTVNGSSEPNGEHENGTSSPGSNNDKNADGSNLTLFWVKDKDAPVDLGSLPADTTHELYTHLRIKALAQRDVAATGTCPYDMDVLYQFWSHFLIRNFNSHMYLEFCQLAKSDATERHNETGTTNLIKYYNECLSSQISIREHVAHDFAELVSRESGKSERSAFDALKTAWRSGSLNLKNRKKLGDLLDDSLKRELDT